MKQETKISSGTVKEFCVQVLRFVLALYHLWNEERKEMGKGRGMEGTGHLALWQLVLLCLFEKRRL